MRILYISNLDGSKSAGLSYSVPSQIKAQSKINQVYWYNINNTDKVKINDSNFLDMKSTRDFEFKNLHEIPKEYLDLNLVIFQGVYHPGYINIAKFFMNQKIPYIIIPRSSLTSSAQNKKKYKKILGNVFLFNKFIKNAIAIQYLTSKEYENSGDRWNDKSLIIPNGIEKKELSNISKPEKELVGIFIGRAEKYQKGIDLLLDACQLLKKELIDNEIRFKLFAASSKKDPDNISKMVSERDLNMLFEVFDGIYDEEKADELKKADFFVLTSRFEGLSMGLIEALSYKLPALVTEGTNMSEEIEKYGAGWASDTSVDGIVKSLRKLMSERFEMKDKGEKAIQLSTNYNWEIIAKNSYQIYKNVLKNASYSSEKSDD